MTEKWKKTTKGFLSSIIFRKKKETGQCVETEGTDVREGVVEEENQNLPLFIKSYGAILLLLLVIVAFSGMTGKQHLVTEEERMTETGGRMVSVTKLEKPENSKGQDTAIKETIQENSSDAAAEKRNQETENWKEKIFGTEEGAVPGRQIFISGLSDSEKEKLSFRESSFMKAVSAFLSEERIDAGTIEFMKKMDVSTDGAWEYLASLKGHDGLYLIVLMYPEYPEKYILSLLRLEGVTDTNAAQGRIPESTAPVQNYPDATREEIAVSGQNPYDATSLSVTGVPSTLVNYLDNRYELQYSLYDYLYRMGKKDTGSAAVTGYSIDPDRRTAIISFRLDDGSEVEGTYQKDSNTYSYSG